MITGKGIIDDFFNKKNPIDKKKILSNICKYTYIYYGIIPFASWFAKDERGVSYEDLLWELFRSANAEETSIGAFLLLAEIKEKYPPVPIGFAQRALTIWCQRDFKDDKVLAYVFNRFPQNRKEWIKILTDYGRFKGDIQLKWGDSSLETILHLCLTMIKGVQTCKIEQIDYFLKPELDRSLNLLTKQIIGLVNNSEEISNHFINELLSAIPNNNLKLTTRMLAFQLLTMKKIKERVEPSHIARVFFSSSVDAPSPLGALLYNTAKEISDLAEDIPIPLKLVARSNRYMNEDYSQIKPEVWKEILHAFHTEIKNNNSIKKLQYPEGFTNDMIVRSLLRETKVQDVQPKIIHEFRGKNYFLSNFYASPVTYNGITYQNSEAAFQAQKDLSRSYEFAELPPNKAKSLGRRVKLRPDWEQVKENIMYDIVYAKFSQNPILKQKLIATGDAELIEGNFWHDNYWGDCTCNHCKNRTGLNKLGDILMDIRYGFQLEN